MKAVSTINNINSDKTNAMEQLQITEIKLNGDGTAFVAYKKVGKWFSKEIKFNPTEQVTEDFKIKFQLTKYGFLGCMPLLMGDQDRIITNSLKFSYEGDFLDTILYSVKYYFAQDSKEVIDISTPKLPVYKEGRENIFTVAGTHVETIHEVIKAAKAYINGETRTKQMKLIVNNEE